MNKNLLNQITGTINFNKFIVKIILQITLNSFNQTNVILSLMDSDYIHSGINNHSGYFPNND